MSPQLPTKVYTHLLIFLICVWLTDCSGRVGTSHVTNIGIQCVENERAALLHFKQGIDVDYCGLLHSWGDGLDCCQWRGIHCNNHSGHVIRLHLPGIFDFNNYNSMACLEGTLSDSLVELKQLKYLDLSLNHFRGQIPKFIGSLSNLEHLNLSHTGFVGVVPQEIGNLSRLSYLDLSWNNMRVTSLRWLSHLRLLEQLDLSGTDLSVAATTWLTIVNSLPFLQVLRLNRCRLSLKLPSSLSYINSSSTLNVVSLSYNNMNDTSILEWMFKLKGLASSLEHLDLSDNGMFGYNVQVSGRAVKFLGSLCSLQTLYLSNSNLYYDFSDIVQSFSLCPHKALISLDLSYNQLWGSIPDSINTLSMLESLDLSLNNLKGVITEEHLSNFSKLRQLDLGGNPELVVHISTDWIPPFQLDTLSLDSCKVGPNFPMWLTTQKHLKFINLDSASISDTIPVSFFNSLSSKLQYLNMSHNMMYGMLPDVSITFDDPPFIDLSFNNFNGAIPPFLRNVQDLSLNNNHLSQGLIPFLCPQNIMPLVGLDLSNNLFSDMLPDCWGYFYNLRALNLQNNKLWGSIPNSIGTIHYLQHVHLGNNNISGELPLSLKNCTYLLHLDLSHNSLTGYIPSTLWDSFEILTVLLLQSNKFIGTLPSSLCQLFRLRILDLSSNFIFGTIPRCIYNLQGMASTTDMSDFGYGDALIMWKRAEQLFTEDLVRTIDFSNNKLEGRIPDGISSLIGLMSINLSSNHLSGAIPSKIGQLTSLESLDLSHNHLSGEIPASLAEINALGVLDLSYNNLTGKIPTGTQLQGFNDSTYMGNLGLCGAPLPKCKGDGAATIPQEGDNATPHHEHHIDDFMLGLYISVVLGVITGFWEFVAL